MVHQDSRVVHDEQMPADMRERVLAHVLRVVATELGPNDFDGLLGAIRSGDEPSYCEPFTDADFDACENEVPGLYLVGGAR